MGGILYFVLVGTVGKDMRLIALAIITHAYNTVDHWLERVVLEVASDVGEGLSLGRNNHRKEEERGTRGEMTVLVHQGNTYSILFHRSNLQLFL